MPTPLPLRSTPEGRAHDVLDIVNHLAEWLEPLRLTVEAADVIEALVTTAASLVDGAELSRIHPAARRWVRGDDRAVIR